VTELPDFLTAYFADRERARAEAVQAFLDSLTDRERALVHDAAVMGYVRGSMHPRGEEIPLNAPIVAHVVNACFAFPNLYPAVNAAFEDRRKTVEYLVQCQQPDGTWEQASSTTTDVKFAGKRLAARRRMQPEYTFRLVRRTTTVVIEAAIEDPS
jgi:prenyltransferase beta subunit